MPWFYLLDLSGEAELTPLRFCFAGGGCPSSSTASRSPSRRWRRWDPWRTWPSRPGSASSRHGAAGEAWTRTEVDSSRRAGIAPRPPGRLPRGPHSRCSGPRRGGRRWRSLQRRGWPATPWSLVRNSASLRLTLTRSYGPLRSTVSRQIGNGVYGICWVLFSIVFMFFVDEIV